MRQIPVAAAALVASCALASCSPDGRHPKNLLLFVVDTLRADRLGVYGSPRPTAPGIDGFAWDALVFENAYAPAPHTAPSHASLFTSTYPDTHRVWNRVAVGDDEFLYPQLSASSRTLAEVLGGHGFQTAAIADGGWLIESRGLAQGFHTFESETRGARDRVRRAIEWLEARDHDRPFFLFVHTYEVHAPYLPPDGYVDRLDPAYRGPVRDALEAARAWQRTATIKDPLDDADRLFFAPLRSQMDDADLAFLLTLYDAELLVVDEAFAELLRYLEEQHLLDDTLVIVTSDHGEEFREHGGFHHTQLYEEGLRIPLIMRHPHGVRGRFEQLVDLVDVMPTALHALGVSAPGTVAGRAIDLLHPDPPTTGGMVVGEVNGTGRSRQVAVRNQRFKAIFRGADQEHVEVYDLQADPLERVDVSDSELGRPFAESARQALAGHWRRTAALRQDHELDATLPASARLSDEQRAQLRMLGYLDD